MLLLDAMHVQQNKIVSCRAQHFDGPLAAVLIEKIRYHDDNSAAYEAAHELLHRTDSPAAQVVSRALLAFTLSGHYTTYHLYGHHRNVGTIKDPATARRGEYVLAFVFRCMVGEFREALRIERARLRRKGLAFVSWHNRILLGELYPLAAMTVVAMMGGYRGFIGFVTAASAAPLIQRLVERAPGQSLSH